MLFSQRLTLHQAIAEYIEQHKRKSSDDVLVLPQLAHHWSKVLESSKQPADDVVRKGLGYMKRMAELASRTNADAEAKLWLDKSMDIANKLALQLLFVATYTCRSQGKSLKLKVMGTAFKNFKMI